MSADTWRDGYSELVVSHGPDGRVHLSVHDKHKPGYTASFSPDVAARIAAFIKGDK